jgi:hypothetical protein
MASTSGWLTAYARELGHELPQRVHVPCYPKGDAWAPTEERRVPTFLDVEELAGRGLLVFPCKAGAKEPATQHGFQNASRDPYQLERWWPPNSRFNVGIATGAKAGVVVVDLDGEAGIANYAPYVAAGMPPTWCALSVAGVHLYFTHPGGIELPNTQQKLGPKIDTRGDGGYIVAPPSLLACGVPYRWLLAPWQMEEPASLPRKVLDAWRPERTSTPSRYEVHRRFEPGQDGDARALAMLDRWAHEIAIAGKGTRDALLVKYAYAAGARVREGKLIRQAAERALLSAISAWGPVSSRDENKVTKGITAGFTGKQH